MNRRQDPPFLMRRPAYFLLLAALLCTISAHAQTVLSNEIPVYTGELVGTLERSIFNGAQGYRVFVPPGATNLTILFETQPNIPVELLVQDTVEVGFDRLNGNQNLGGRAAQYRTYPDNAGRAVINIGLHSEFRLIAGVYYIGFITQEEDTTFSGWLTATLSGGPIESLYDVVSSDFERGDDGWTRATSTGGIPGAHAGDPEGRFEHLQEKGNPYGHIEIISAHNDADEFFVAPDKFLVNMAELSEPRLHFDIARVAGFEGFHRRVEVMIFGENGGWRWIGREPPPPIIEFEFFSGERHPIWRTEIVELREEHWARMGDAAGFLATIANPKRIEIRGAFIFERERAGLDNVRLLARGTATPQPVLPVIQSFSGGYDRWTRNYPASEIPGAATGDMSSTLLWEEVDGNPGPRIVLAETGEQGGPAPDAFVAPLALLGIYTDLDNPRFEFDYRHFSFGGAERPVTIRIFGSGAVYEWSGAVPLDIWGHQVAPLDAEQWVEISGGASFDAVLAAVSRIEVSADQAQGRERNSLDNFALLTEDSPAFPQQIVVSEAALSLTSAATEGNPESRSFQVTSSGGSLRWGAQVTSADAAVSEEGGQVKHGSLAERVILSETEGDTPSEVSVTIDTHDLAAGLYSFQIAISALGTTLTPQVVNVTLNLSAQPAPTPIISEGGVVLSASYSPRLTAGALATVFGGHLGGPVEGILTSFTRFNGDQLPTEVNGVRVLVYEMFDRLIAEAPLIYLDNQQINFQMPYEVAGRASVKIIVAVGNVRSAPQVVQITPSSPGVFSYNGNRAIAVNADGRLNSSEQPATRMQAMTLYLTGQGQTSPEWASGRAASDYPLIHAPSKTVVHIGGVEAKITFAGLAPGLVGVTQINFEPSYFTPVGDQDLIVNLGGFDSNVTRVTIR